jgi:hypothetical protein
MKALVTVLLAFFVSASWAALGGHPEQYGVKPARHKVQAKTTAGSGYTVDQSTLGTVVREYADASGTVFAVSWSGPSVPDLKRLLGPYSIHLTPTPDGQPHGDRQNVVIKHGGHTGSFNGVAWLPEKLPAGFDPNKDLQ